MDVDDILLCHVLGREYGWTPSQIERLPWKTIQGLLVLLQVSAAKQHSAQQEIQEENRA